MKRMVRICGAFNLKTCPISEYQVSCEADDLLLALKMLPIYVNRVDAVRDDIQYRVYYRKKFLTIAELLAEAEDLSTESISCSYLDLKLIICMFRDAWTWNGTEYADCQDFRRIADDISGQIGYDYDAAMEKCRKKAEKEDRDDVGGEAMSLMLKKAQREAEYQRKKKEKEGKNK